MERIGQVKHVRPCPFNGQTVIHVVLVVPQGKLTVLVMPALRMEGRRRAAKEGMYAAVVALQNGSVGVIGTDADVVESVAATLQA
jgi:predicted transcriptional regulator